MAASCSSNAPPRDTLILLQHPSVYTLGAGSSTAHLHFDPESPPHPLHRTERGGEVTYHGPGQWVMYPIVNLKQHTPDLHWYLRSLEQVVIRYCSFSVLPNHWQSRLGNGAFVLQSCLLALAGTVHVLPSSAFISLFPELHISCLCLSNGLITFNRVQHSFVACAER